MSEEIADDNFLTFKIKNKRPVALEDFSNSVRAFGRSYENYIAAKSGLNATDDVKFYIKELKTGSLIAVLQTIAEQANFVIHHADTIAPFLTHFNELVHFFSGMMSAKELESLPTKKEAENILKVFEPTAKDHGSSLAFQFNGPVTIGTMNLNYTSQTANAAQNGARRFIGPALPSNETYTDELLIFKQIRDAKTAAHDRGIIESISKKPVKLWFASDAVKQAVLGQPGNIFHVAFIVDVTVKTVNDQPALYKILAVKEIFERPEHP